MSAILLAVDGPQAGDWLTALRAHAKGRAVRAWPGEAGAADDIAYACVWLPPPGLLARFRHLKAVINLGAGVDHLLADPALPGVPIARAVHPDLTHRVVEYVVLHVLMHHRRQRLYDSQQAQRLWCAHPQPAAGEISVGVMGLGAIGSEAALALAGLGFSVVGWSRTARALPGVATFHGADALEVFLGRTEILVCLLPHTPQTKGLLNLALLRKLRRDGPAGGAFLINAARGSLQVDADIVVALDEGTLFAATLDVFPQEPLPSASPLWIHPRVTVTPHNAGDISPQAFAPHVIAQIERFERGETMSHLIDRARGY